MTMADIRTLERVFKAFASRSRRVEALHWIRRGGRPLRSLAPLSRIG